MLQEVESFGDEGGSGLFDVDQLKKRSINSAPTARQHSRSAPRQKVSFHCCSFHGAYT